MYGVGHKNQKSTVMKTRIIFAVLTLLLLGACEKNGKNEWEDLYYARIARENYRRENDRGYTPPTVSGCVDDDLFNCNPRNNYR